MLEYWRGTKSANRIKSHFDPSQRKGIRLCPQLDRANTGSNKRLKSDVSASNLEQNPTNVEGHGKGYLLPTVDLVGYQFQSYIEAIWKWIMEDEVSAIGVWGMGGVGKTALVTHINNKLLKEANGHFDHVIWITVSQDDSIFQLQKSIAKSIGLDISDECDVKRIAGKLLHAFKQINKCVLILDEVWDNIWLENVGFPVPHKGIQLILTTRSWEVCQSMNCENNILKVELLGVKDGCDLFKRTLGVHQTLSCDVSEIARTIVKECEGLPQAIVTIARSMKGKNSVREWNHMLKSLKSLENGQYDIDKWVLPVLRSSYTHLNNKFQECFLYCTLYTKCEDNGVHTMGLTRRFVYEGWIDGMKLLKTQYDECRSILNKFYLNSLLLKRLCEEWQMHNLVRVMAVKENDTIMAKANMNQTNIPDDSKWKDLQKVFLSNNNIQKIPDGASPRCSQLSTLLLNDNYNLEFIPDNFFINMPTLRVLDLSKTNIKHLPTSVSNLGCLVALLLSYCFSLSHVPSLAKLRQLISLDLSYTAITETRLDLELLTNLRRLNLQGTEQLKMSMSSIIPKLTNLQSLYLNCKPEMDVRVPDLRGCKELETILATFCDINVFNAYVRNILNGDRLLKQYFFNLTQTNKYLDEIDNFMDVSEFSSGEYSQRKVRIEGMELGNIVAVLPEDLKNLYICECEHQWTRCLCHVLTFRKSNNPCKMDIFDISRCDKLKNLHCFSHNCLFCSTVQLCDVRLKNLKELQNIAAPFTSSQLLAAPFSHLKHLY